MSHLSLAELEKQLITYRHDFHEYPVMNLKQLRKLKQF